MAKLCYFGRLTDVTGTAEEVVGLPPHVSDTGSLVSWLETGRGWTGLLSDRCVRIVVNNEIQDHDIDICDTDEIGFLPPVGGG
jgi:molybdopterin converting factor small subunit